jgi:hypothetical protein
MLKAVTNQLGYILTLAKQYPYSHRMSPFVWLRTAAGPDPS